ncbi:hypothetical protein V6N12_074220 [Hibiscus sabdariffa]|uniref:Isopenicillin N synthase-like Fe(2+) 2OG dioxygenase domain-containing protein n=1 Tax=Hibiscus sabdariffa TaxID=183260 RepID=A0ABR2BI57_9ROSI
MKWYSRDYKQPVRYFCNGDLLVNKGAANWRDSIAFDFHDSQLDPQLFPPICREAVSAFVINIGDFIQLITNDKFKSVEHRVLAGQTPRQGTGYYQNLQIVGDE